MVDWFWSAFVLTALLPAGQSLICYECQENGAECTELSDPGKLIECPSVYSLMIDPMNRDLSARWQQLPVQKTQFALLMMVQRFFEPVLQKVKEPLLAIQNQVQPNITYLKLQDLMFGIVKEMTEEQTENVCVYRQNVITLGELTKKHYFRHCYYNKPVGLGDWNHVEEMLKKNTGLQPCTEGGNKSACAVKYCTEDLCNKNGLFYCMQCGGGEHICGENDYGVSTACGPDYQYCIKEASGDSANRQIFARYCGTRYDYEAVCDGEQLGISANGQAHCCSNRDNKDCNHASKSLAIAYPLLTILVFVTSKVMN